MFSVGDRVKLVADFDNEPGIIPANTEGIVLGFSKEMVFVQFVNVEHLDVSSQKHNKLAGLPIFIHEIEESF